MVVGQVNWSAMLNGFLDSDWYIDGRGATGKKDGGRQKTIEKNHRIPLQGHQMIGQAGGNEDIDE